MRVACTAADSLAEMRARSRFGIAIAAMIKMIATTISNSINEKPELARARALEPIVPAFEKKIKPPVCSTVRRHLWTDRVSLALDDSQIYALRLWSPPLP